MLPTLSFAGSYGGFVVKWKVLFFCVLSIPLFDRRRPSLRPYHGLAFALGAVADKAGRRPPPEAARSGLEGGWARCDPGPVGGGLCFWLRRGGFVAVAHLGGSPGFRRTCLQARIRRNHWFTTMMPHMRGQWGAWGAGPILTTASFSHSRRRSPAHPGWVQQRRHLPLAGSLRPKGLYGLSVW